MTAGRIISRAVWAGVALVLGYVALVAAANLTANEIPVRMSPAPEGTARVAQEPLQITSWNLGYAGLGADSDFVADRGKMFLPPSRAAVARNLASIQSTLSGFDSDVLLLQETARPGLMNRGVDVLGGVRAALPDYEMFFSSDIRTKLMPRPLSLEHGLAMMTRVEAPDPRILRLPEEPQAMFGIVRRHYHTQVLELEVSGRPWTVMNIHLSAFDEGADVRLQQLRAVFTIAQEAYAQGRAVVIGGDWNMVLTPTSFAHNSDQSALFWIHDFPRDELPEGWQVVTDPSTPTVRTNERPYHAGENYTTIIDGMIVSPNVAASDVHTLNLGFAASDHQPVTALLRRTD
ncbi:MAG: hypothetical protein KF779_15645 [Hyphomonadaceae bacterium]|nr:hypothetical protein [Hyphomonadaceae bacterium]